MELGRLRSLDIRNPYPRLDPDPWRNLPTSSRVPVRRVVVQSGPSRVGTQSGDNYSVGRYPDVPPSATSSYLLLFFLPQLLFYVVTMDVLKEVPDRFNSKFRVELLLIIRVILGSIINHF